MSASTRPLLAAEEIALRARAEATPFLCLPERENVFSTRAQRLRQLAAGHAIGDYLLFAAEIAGAQHEALRRAPPLTLPTLRQIDAAASAGVPLVATAGWPRDGAWRGLLRDVLEALAAGVAEPAAGVARRLAQSADGDLELLAERLLRGRIDERDVAAAPLLAAGLQVYFMHLVASTQAAYAFARKSPAQRTPFGRTDDPTRCPCCGSLPTASVVRPDATEPGHRYLHCSLCASQWHYVRIKCSRCQGTQGISYEAATALPGDPGGAAALVGNAVQAECCGACGHYLKLVQMAKDPQAEPVADDLASLTLDLLLADEGKLRHGVNLLLVFGQPDAAGRR